MKHDSNYVMIKDFVFLIQRDCCDFLSIDSIDAFVYNSDKAEFKSWFGSESRRF